MDEKYYISKILSIVSEYENKIEDSIKAGSILTAAFYGHKLIHNLYVELSALESDKEVSKQAKSEFSGVYNAIKSYIEGKNISDFDVIKNLLSFKEILNQIINEQRKEIKKL